MQTIEEYKAYCKQLENEVGTWHHAYDALMVERNQLVHNVLNLEAQNKVYEQRIAEHEEIDKARMKHINDCEKACKEMASKIAALETELEQSKEK